LAYIIFQTAAGWVGVMGSINGIKRTTLPQSSRDKALAELGSDDREKPDKDLFRELTTLFQGYFAGQRSSFPDNLDLSEATGFQRRVWEAARQIPYGETGSYGWIARKIGKPGAARAVGQALGKNPLPIIVPCHRVISSDGSLGGFSGGLEMKRQLLALEKRGGPD
jgi:methylated-DNA-[protein]-cysteine S-methyltransferase